MIENLLAEVVALSFQAPPHSTTVKVVQFLETLGILMKSAEKNQCLHKH